MGNIKNVRWMLSLLIVFIITGCSNLTSNSSHEVKENSWYPVRTIISSSTFEIDVNDHIEQITFLSLDVPNETSSQQFDLPIRAFIEEKLLQSKEVKLKFDVQKRNEQGQLLAVVELRDGTNLNEQLLEIGYAKVLIEEPNVKMENIYKQLEQLAKSNSAGIWLNSEETSNDDVRIKETVFQGILLSVDKKLQQATISNYSSKDINLENWKLVSVTGTETYIFDELVLKPGEHVELYANNSSSEANQALYWGNQNVWDLTQKESAELYDDKNELIAVWTE